MGVSAVLIYCRDHIGRGMSARISDTMREQSQGQTVTTKRPPLDMFIVAGLSIGGMCLSVVLLIAAIVCAVVGFVMFMNDGEWPRMTICTVYRFANSPPYATYAMFADSRCSYEFSMRGLNVILSRLFDDTALLPFLLLAFVASYALSWGIMLLHAHVRDI
jgi:hypothetical protein